MRDHEFQNSNPNPFADLGNPETPRAPAMDLLGLLRDVAERLSKVEADNADMRSQIDSAKKDGALDFDSAHAVHVLNKHFFHDKPEVEVSAPPRPKFDAFTGQPLQ